MKGIIFDLDGTLLDTIEDLAEAVNYALKNNGFEPLTVATVREYVGNGARKLVERCLPQGLENPLYEKCFEEYSEYYRAHLTVHTKPYDGIKELLAELKKRNIKTGVLSNKPHRAAKPLVQSYFGNLIDAASGEREGIPKKPSPQGVLAVLDELGIEKNECIYIGDSDVDIVTAKNSGMMGISCLWGFRTREFLEKNGGKIFVEKPSEILRFI